METTATPEPLPLRPPDVQVTLRNGNVILDPCTLRAQAWLARNMPAETRDDAGRYVIGPLRASHTVLCIAMDGLEVR